MLRAPAAAGKIPPESRRGHCASPARAPQSHCVPRRSRPAGRPPPPLALSGAAAPARARTCGVTLHLPGVRAAWAPLFTGGGRRVVYCRRGSGAPAHTSAPPGQLSRLPCRIRELGMGNGQKAALLGLQDAAEGRGASRVSWWWGVRNELGCRAEGRPLHERKGGQMHWCVLHGARHVLGALDACSHFFKTYFY